MATTFRIPGPADDIGTQGASMSGSSPESWMPPSGSPMSAADNHALSAGQGSWFSNAFDSVAESISNAPKYWRLAAASGLVGLVNTGTEVANWFLPKQAEFEDWSVEGFQFVHDDNLQQYYADNKTSIDTAGFFLGGLAPGMGGVRALKAGQALLSRNLAAQALETAAQSGAVGANLSMATRLLVPSADRYIAQSTAKIAATQRTAGFMQAERLKALGSRAWQGVLESAAFETAALATQFKSPFLEEMDTSDIVFNSALNVAFGGLIYGALAIPGVNRAIYRGDQSRGLPGVEYFESLNMFGRKQAQIGSNAPAPAKIIMASLNRDQAEAAIKWNMDELERLAQPDATSGIPNITVEEATKIANARLATARGTVEDLNNQIRTHVREATPNDEVGNWFADAIIRAPSESRKGLALAMDRMVRGVDADLLQKQASAQLRKAIKEAEATGLDPASLPDSPTMRTSWTDLHGTGKVTDGALPADHVMADMVKLKGRSGVSGNKSALEDAVDKYVSAVKPKISDMINMADVDKLKPLEAQARYLSASRAKLGEQITVGAQDYPFLEAAYRRMSEGAVKKVTVSGQGEFTTPDALFKYIQNAKTTSMQAAIKQSARRKATGEPLEVLAQRLNMNPDYVRNASAGRPGTPEDFLHWQTQAKAMGLEGADQHKFWYRPKYMGTHIAMPAEELAQRLETDAATFAASFKKVNDGALQNATTQVTGALYGQVGPRGTFAEYLPESSVLEDGIRHTNLLGAEPGALNQNNGAYGSQSEIYKAIGTIAQQMGRKAGELVDEVVDSVRDILLTDTAAAAEFSVTNQLVSKSQNPLRMMEGRAGLEAFNPATGEALEDVAPILFKNRNTAKIWEAHLELNARKIAGYKPIRAAQGLEYTYDPGQVYPLRPDLAHMKYFAFVVDDSIVGGQKMSMIHGSSDRELMDKIAQLRQEFPDWRVVTKSNSEEYHKARGDYQYDRTIHEIKMDSAMASRGIMNDPLPVTDGKALLGHLRNHHTKQFRALNAEIIHAKYDMPFRELEAMARASGDPASSRISGVWGLAEASPKDPWLGYIRTALNIQNQGEMPLLNAANRFVDESVSAVWNSASNALAEMKGVSVDKLAAVNDIFESHGFKPGYYDAATMLIANRSQDRNLASRFVRGSSALLSTTFLRWDPFNAMVNKLGSTVLTSTELTSVLTAMAKRDASIVGKLAHVMLPGTEDSILSPQKLISNSLRRFWEDIRGPNAGKIGAEYKALGLDTDYHASITGFMDDLSFTGGETAAVLNQKLQRAYDWAQKAGQFGEKVTGNKIMEHMNRFVASDIMKQITDVAVEQGTMSPGEAWTYVRTFVNRTQVNYNSVQSARLFSGPIGKAMGLFQSYQFNLMQQLFRHVGEGSSKTLAMYAGLQGTFFGLNGLPGFQVMNSYVAQLAGNPNQYDLTDTLSDGVPAGMASWLLYGAPSNLLHANLYSRGDATPQNPTVLPTSISGFPLINMYSRFFGNLKRTAGNVMEGADLWPAFLSGLEFNSINRPLAGVAQVLRGVTDGSNTVGSYDQLGKFISGNDLWSLATAARVMGGRPLDEAVTRREMYKLQAVRTAQRQKLNEAGAALRLSMQGDGDPSDSQVDSVYGAFLNAGMKSADFNRWMMRRYVEANEPEVANMQRFNSLPQSRRMQILLGGEDIQGGM